MNYLEHQTVERANNLLQSLKPRPGTLGLSDKDVRAYSMRRAAQRMFDANNGNRHEGFDGLEAECSRELEKVYGPCPHGRFYVPFEITHERALSTQPGSKGGYAVGADLVGFIDALYNTSVCFQLGAQRITNQTSDATLVKEKTAPTATWQGVDGTSVAVADPAFTQISAKPKTVIALHELSEQLLKQDSPMTEAGVRRGLSLALGVAVDQAMLVGTGGVQPLGITNTPNINTVTGGAITRAVLLDMQTQSVNSNAVINPSAQGYVGTPTVAAVLAGRQQFTGVDSPMWAGTIARGTVCGAPALATKSLNTGNLIFGDFSQLMLVEFGPLMLAVNRSDTRFNQGIVAIRALWMVDVMVLEAKSFTLAATTN